MGNLAHMAALAEYTFGGGQHRENLVVIHIARASAPALFCKVSSSMATPMAQASGHAAVVEQGQLCNCGNYGCLDTVADCRAIAGAHSSWLA